PMGRRHHSCDVSERVRGGHSLAALGHRWDRMDGRSKALDREGAIGDCGEKFGGVCQGFWELAESVFLGMLNWGCFSTTNPSRVPLSKRNKGDAIETASSSAVRFVFCSMVRAQGKVGTIGIGRGTCQHPSKMKSWLRTTRSP